MLPCFSMWASIAGKVHVRFRLGGVRPVPREGSQGRFFNTLPACNMRPTTPFFLSLPFSGIPILFHWREPLNKKPTAPQEKTFHFPISSKCVSLSAWSQKELFVVSGNKRIWSPMQSQDYIISGDCKTGIPSSQRYPPIVFLETKREIKQGCS